MRLIPSTRIVPVPASMVVVVSTPTPKAAPPAEAEVKLRPRSVMSPPPVETPLVLTLVSMFRAAK